MRSRLGSAAGDDGDDVDVGGVPVEVLSSAVVDGRGERVRVAGRKLDVAQRNVDVEGGHDERCAQLVRVDGAEPRSLTDRSYPTVRGAPIEERSVATLQDRSLVAFADRKVDPSCSTRHLSTLGRLAACVRADIARVVGAPASVICVFLTGHLEAPAIARVHSGRVNAATS